MNGSDHMEIEEKNSFLALYKKHRKIHTHTIEIHSICGSVYVLHKICMCVSLCVEWKLCLNYDFTYNKWVWWLEKCKTRTHTRSLENVWHKHLVKSTLRISWNKWRKNSHRQKESEKADDNRASKRRERLRERENRCMWLNYLPFAQCIYFCYSLIHFCIYILTHVYV